MIHSTKKRLSPFYGVLLSSVYFISVAAQAMDNPVGVEENDPSNTPPLRQTSLEEKQKPSQQLVRRRGRPPISDESIRQVVDFLQASPLNWQRAAQALNSFARRHRLPRQVVAETIIKPVLNYMLPTPSFLPVKFQFPKEDSEIGPTVILFVVDLDPEKFPSINEFLFRRRKGSSSFSPIQDDTAFRATWLEPTFSKRASLLLTSESKKGEEETPSHTGRWQQRAFDWTYTISEYIENYPYATMLWLMVLSFLFSISRH